MTFSSEIEIFKRVTHQAPIFVGEISRSTLKISSEIEVFKRSSEIDFFQDSGPLGSVPQIQQRVMHRNCQTLPAPNKAPRVSISTLSRH